MKTGAEMIADERWRQVAEKGWTPEHDDRHEHNELAIAAACYAAHGTDDVHVVTQHGALSMGGKIFVVGEEALPFGELVVFDSMRKKRLLRRLVIAGALIAAEIDRLLRAGAK